MIQSVRTKHSVWPVRYKPQEDELLSSWLVRLSHGMGLKVQTLCNMEFGNQRQVWNRDIDRLGPQWLIETLSRRTGTPLIAAQQTSLRTYDGILYRRFKPSGALQWVLMLKMYHRTWQGFGLMYCPICLAVGDVPYYRKSWRLAINTVCLQHRCMLLDRCPVCRSGVAFTRTDLGHPGNSEFPDLNVCHACGFDLRMAEVSRPACLDIDAAIWLTHLWGTIESCNFSKETKEQIQVLHVVCSLLTRNRRALHLSEYISDRLGVQPLETSASRIPLELRSIEERHQLLQMAAWLLVDLRVRLQEAVQDHAVRINHLTRDFGHLPNSFRQVAQSLPHKRGRW